MLSIQPSITPVSLLNLGYMELYLSCYVSMCTSTLTSNQCTEGRPLCANCNRLGVACIYPSTESQSSSPGALVSAAISHMTAGIESPGEQPLSMLDLELLHCYINDFIPSSVLQTDMIPIFTKTYVDIGLSEAYVLHTLLAISALHLYWKNPSRTELFARATSLQATALRLAQPHIVHLSQKHCMGVFVFSSFTAHFALAEVMLNPHDSSSLRDPVEEIINCFQLTRGVATVVAPFWTYLQASCLSPIFEYEDNRSELLPFLERDFPTYASVRELARGQEYPERRDACIHAVELLFLYISILRSNPESHPSFRIILSWPVEVRKPYMEMISERDPFALVVLAYYAVLMQSRDYIPYITNAWPRYIMDYVDGALGDEWEPYLAWPRHEVKVRSTVVDAN